MKSIDEAEAQRRLDDTLNIYTHVVDASVAPRGDRAGRAPVVPNCSQVAEIGHSVRCAKCQETCWLELEAPPGFEPGVEVLQTSALPLGDGAPVNTMTLKRRALETTRQTARVRRVGAGNGIRTRDFDLGKVALYH